MTAAASQTVVFITGGNTGLGYEVVKALLEDASKPYLVLLGSRSLDRAKEAIDKVKKEAGTTNIHDIKPYQVDYASDESIKSCYEQVKSEVGHVDVLINNGGLAISGFDPETQDIRKEWATMYDTNVTGTHILTHTFMPLLFKSSIRRLLFITSGTASCEEAANPPSRPGAYIVPPPPAGWPKPPTPQAAGYRSSKVALNMLMLVWKNTLENDNFKVWAVSPGFLATNLANIGPEKLKSMGAQDPRVGGEFLKAIVEGKHDERSGMAIRSTIDQPW